MGRGGSSLVQQLILERLKFRSVVAVVVGFVLATVGRWPDVHSVVDLLEQVIAPELGLALITAGVVGVLIDYRNRRHGAQDAIEQQRQALREEAPTVAEAALTSLVLDWRRLRDMIAPALLERFAVNALIARWGSEQFVRDMFTELRDLMNAPERWRDVTASVNLTPWTGGPVSGPVSMFNATVRWGYKVIPGVSELRFACVSDPGEHQRLSRDPSVVFAWLWAQPAPLPAEAPEVFELVTVIINGLACQPHRSTRSGAQIYTVPVPELPAGQEITVTFTYRVLVQRHGHVLWLDVPRAAHGLDVDLHYDQAGIRQVTVLDQLASPDAPRIDQTAQALPDRVIQLGVDGWVRPHAGVAFCWTLDDELPAAA